MKKTLLERLEELKAEAASASPVSQARILLTSRSGGKRELILLSVGTDFIEVCALEAASKPYLYAADNIKAVSVL